MNLLKLIEDEIIEVERDEAGIVVGYSENGEVKNDVSSNYEAMWLRYGQINAEGLLHGVGRRVRIDYWSGSSCAERWSYMEEGQFVNDELQGFGRRLMLWNTDWQNRIGWGKDNEQRGKTADNFKLDGLGRKWDGRPNESANNVGRFENDEFKDDAESLPQEDKDKCDFDQWLLTKEEVMELRQSMI